MESTQLLKRKVDLFISDPWDFGTVCGSGPFSGEITQFDERHILVGLDCPISYQGITYFSVLCAVRHTGVTVRAMRAGRDMHMNLILLPMHAECLSDIHVDDQRKGLAGIGAIRLST